jgi:hypothetical protein
LSRRKLQVLLQVLLLLLLLQERCQHKLFI